MDNPHSAGPADDRLPFGTPFTTARAVAAGVTLDQLSRMVREGLLRRVFNGAYVDAAAEDTGSTCWRAGTTASLHPLRRAAVDVHAGASP
ncbi:MAG: type IV toxin-antitoxin system AbiEi family antitoxin domain-containing protein, partial [Nocardioides sp.]